MAFSQILEPVKWSFDSKKTGDNEFELHFTPKIESGWYVYSQNIEEGGPVPTSFEFEDIEGYKLVGKVTETGPVKEEHSEIFDMVLRYYKKDVKFIQKVKLSGSKASPKGYFTFMTCNDKTCLPPTDVEFSFDLEGTSGAVDDGSRSEVTPPTEETTNPEKEETHANIEEKQPENKEEIASISEEAKNIKEEKRRTGFKRRS